ncbi:MAG: hypothetical protein KF729_26615 [Sandaracinaceae bacterium]|nr:hypothetical protein [Sandaracinaceae bacterium]
MTRFSLVLLLVVAVLIVVGCGDAGAPVLDTHDADARSEDAGARECSPTAERCDGVTDEDCDGVVDEDCDCVDGRTRACGTDVGACVAGVETCADGAWGRCTGAELARAETCDGLLDEDCDGTTDEDCACADGAVRSCGLGTGSCVAGTETCADGAWGACNGMTGPAAERCDGVEDEDCDGVVDEGCACAVGASRPCGSDVGRCALGAQSCAAGVWSECVGAIAPIAERCDGVEDDDCDGRVDEGCGCTDGASRSCGSDVGACVAGAQICAAGAWGTCLGAIGPRPETCDGTLDENCNGVVDDGCACTNGASRSCGSDVGECVAGAQTCAAGAWGLCLGAIGPRPETCDGTLDEDCDGVVDDGCACTNGAACSDADACTVNDVCESGVCVGEPRVCDTPPSPTCIGSALRTYAAVGACAGGACTHAPTDTICPFGCAGGACRECSPSWVFSDIAPGVVSNSPRSVAVDAAGRAHVVYGAAGFVQYARRTSTGAWVSERVGSGERPEIARSAGSLHIAYVERLAPGGFGLRHRFTMGDGVWLGADLSAVPASTATPIALDALGGAHISYAVRPTVGSRSLSYTFRRADGTYPVEPVVDGPVDVGHTSAIALDSAGGVHVAYLRPYGTVWHAHRSAGGIWSREIIQDSVGSATDPSPSLAIDSSDGLHVTYSDSVSGQLRHARRTAAGTWTVSDVARGWQQASVAVDAMGGVHLIAVDALGSGLGYARRPAGAEAWETETLRMAGFVLEGRPALALDGAGGAHIVYYRGAPETLRYGYRAACP